MIFPVITDIAIMGVEVAKIYGFEMKKDDLMSTAKLIFEETEKVTLLYITLFIFSVLFSSLIILFLR